MALASMVTPGRTPGRVVGNDAHQQVGFGGDVVADVRSRVRPRQPRAPRPHRHLEPQTIAWNHGQTELGVVHAAQVGAVAAPGLARLRQQNRRDLCQRLDHQHARHQRRARKMPLEELLVDRDVLEGDHAPPRLVLGNGVDQRGWIAIAEPVESCWDVDRH